VAEQVRCFAPDVFRNSTPKRVALGTVPVPIGIMQKPRSLVTSPISGFSSGTTATLRTEEKQMTTDPLEMESRFTRIVGRESRSQSIAIRFTRDEARALSKKAEDNGQNLREWSREVLLGELREE